MSLASKAVRGAIWTISAGIGARAIGLVGTLVITRFVAPDAYGQVMVASVLVLTAQQFSTLGLSQYLIASPDCGRRIGFHATAYHLLTGVVAFVVLGLVGSWAGRLLGAPEIGGYMPGLIAAAVVDRVAHTPERILVRDLRFAPISGARTAGDVAYSALSVSLAATGMGAMAIVWGNLARSIARAVLLIWKTDLRDWFSPCKLTLAETKTLFAFGLPVSIASISNFASRRWDNLLVSSFFGPGPAGMYNLAYNLADVPAIQLGEQIGDVLFPSFARLDPERRKQALVRALALLGLVVFPLAVGLGAVAHTLVAVLFDERWRLVGPMLMILSIMSVTRPVSWTLASYLKAIRLPRPVMWIEILAVAALLGSVFTIGRLGPLWTCTAVGLAFIAQVLVQFGYVAKREQIPLRTMLLSVWGPLSACAIMAGCVFVARYSLDTPSWSSKLLALSVEVGVGASSYLVAVAVVAQGPARELIQRVRDALRRRVSLPSGAPAPQ